MKFEDALIELRNGYKISRKGQDDKWVLEKGVNKPISTDSLMADDWMVIPQKKEPKLMAPAITKLYAKIYVSDMLFESEEDAREQLTDGTFISWPAVPDDEGFYSVEDV